MNLRLLAFFFFLGATVGLRGGESYNFFMISDPHFGPAKSFCTDPKVDRKYRTRKNIRRGDRTVKLYEELFARIGAEADARTRFIIEGGDLIEGCTTGEETHKQVLADAVNFMKRYFKFPIYMVRGNHEAVGLGGENAYRAVLLPEMAKYAGVAQLSEANYTIRQGEDLYIFLDYASPRKHEFLRSTLKSLKKKPRWLFTVIHTPLLPTWGFRDFALPACRLLSQYNGILLCGHHHENTITRWEEGGNKLVQVTVTTLFFPGPAKNTGIREQKTDVEGLKKTFRENAERKKQKAWIPVFDREWAPSLKEYRAFSGAGFARFYVSDDGVDMIYQSADPAQKPLKIRLARKQEK